MKRNQIRIVCNPIAKHISYYYKNELNEWLTFSDSSPLSRNYYTVTSMEERSEEIITLINEIYNRKNKGLDITFEGDDDSYFYFEKAVRGVLGERDVRVKNGKTKVIVTGKVGSGKTTLIEGIAEFQTHKCNQIEYEHYYLYKDDNNSEWYEIKGIDFGEKNIERAYQTICDVARDTSAIIVYCIHSSNRRIEKTEKEFIRRLISVFPELAGMIVLTQCVNKKGLNQFMDEVKRITDNIKVVPTLAKDFITDIEDEKTGKLIELKAFGLEDLAEYIFERR